MRPVSVLSCLLLVVAATQFAQSQNSRPESNIPTFPRPARVGRHLTRARLHRFPARRNDRFGAHSALVDVVSPISLNNQ
jgi:hypothetical protein